jgi:hypothetical protein
MTDDPEEVEDEGYSEETEISAGSFVIHDTAWWCSPEGMNAAATQVTDECGVFVVDRESGKLRAVLLDDGKGKPKLSRIQ